MVPVVQPRGKRRCRRARGWDTLVDSMHRSPEPLSGFQPSASPAIFLGLGSNLGDRARHLDAATAALERRGFHTDARSARYLTEPVDAPPQDWFLNAVVRGTSALSPRELLRACLAVESEHGRERRVHHGPRTLDLDILLFGDLVLDEPGLCLPHPHLHERRFVLVPLCEIAPAVRHPKLQRSAAELLAACPDTGRVLPAPQER
jgi:2-amino-4-hydroxy-6-hydroxymethyldihydropteridine diphosphokinase